MHARHEAADAQERAARFCTLPGRRRDETARGLMALYAQCRSQFLQEIVFLNYFFWREILQYDQGTTNSLDCQRAKDEATKLK